MFDLFNLAQNYNKAGGGSSISPEEQGSGRFNPIEGDIYLEGPTASFLGISPAPGQGMRYNVRTQQWEYKPGFSAGGSEDVSSTGRPIDSGFADIPAVSNGSRPVYGDSGPVFTGGYTGFTGNKGPGASPIPVGKPIPTGGGGLPSGKDPILPKPPTPTAPVVPPKWEQQILPQRSTMGNFSIYRRNRAYALPPEMLQNRRLDKSTDAYQNGLGTLSRSMGNQPGSTSPFMTSAPKAYKGYS